MTTQVAIKPVVQPGRFQVKRYNVIIHNDNTTPFDFVVLLLQQVFDYDVASGAKVTRVIHVDGKAIVATYTKEVADDKVSIAASMIYEAKFPLQIEVVEEDESI